MLPKIKSIKYLFYMCIKFEIMKILRKSFANLTPALLFGKRKANWNIFELKLSNFSPFLLVYVCRWQKIQYGCIYTSKFVKNQVLTCHMGAKSEFFLKFHQNWPNFKTLIWGHFNLWKLSLGIFKIQNTLLNHKIK